MTRPRVARLTPEQRSMQARLAALTRWSKETDRSAATRAARDALAAKWAEFPDPEAARLAHLERMRLASSRACRKSA